MDCTKQTVWSGENSNLLEQTAWCRDCEMSTVSHFLIMHINSTVVWLWCLYLTIRQRVWVVYMYEQIFNEARRVDYHALIDNNCKLSNCFSPAESMICNTPLVGLYWIPLGCSGSSAALYWWAAKERNSRPQLLMVVSCLPCEIILQLWMYLTLENLSRVIDFV